MEECINHFSHEHQLSFFQEDGDVYPKPYMCNICGLPILSSPSYTCSICNFFLHKPCTEFPEELYHHGHMDTLYLDFSVQNFAYKCRNYSRCKFDLHPLVAKPLEIKIKHISHISHSMVAFCRKTVSLCDGCGEEQTGFFFHCAECNFWIHQECTILPGVVKLPSQHPHPYILAYSFPYAEEFSQTRPLSISSCTICHRQWRLPNSGVYLCAQCYSFAHPTCVKSNMKNLEIDSTELMQLPDEEDIFPNLVIRRFLERNPITQTDSYRFHQHPLILEHGTNSCREGSDHNLVCDVCIQPINTSPFYRCQQLESCRFLAHAMCRNHLPTKTNTFILGESRKVILSNSDEMSYVFFNSVFPCYICHRPSNGFCYTALGGNSRTIILLDLECAVAPKTIKHTSHKQHVLFQTIQSMQVKDGKVPLRCCAGESLTMDLYKCVVCDFYIHVRCALLPKRTRHEFDEHPLELIMSSYHNEDDRKEYHWFCELCEEGIDQRFWYYGCGKCEHYFHINCLPSVGYLSRVKFGRTHVDSMNIHNHPLTLTRMLTIRRHAKCGVCSQIIKGFTDDKMAFRCSLCDFWVHFSCACLSTGLKDYSEFLDNFARVLRAVLNKFGAESNKFDI